MSLSRQGNITGYHGTHSNNVQDILSKGFTYKFKADHWLGQGVYFYTTQDLAKWWIETRTGPYYCAVIEVLLDCGNFNVLDLDSVLGLDFFLREVRIILTEIETYSFEEDNRYKNLCFVLDLLKKKFDIEMVICTFLKNRPTYSKENLMQFQDDYFRLPFGVQFKETQICICTNKTVLNKKCVYNNLPPKISKFWK